MARAMPGFTAAVATTTLARPHAMVQTVAESSRKAWVYPQARITGADVGLRARAEAEGGASCTCPCCIITGGVLYCC
jgi:hypothetical protein